MQIKSKSPTHKSSDKIKQATAEDYSENMFLEGKNRAEKNTNIRNAPDYDKVVRNGKRNEDAD
ncbi:MAG: hypothetical protein U1E36_00995 [Rickettsiales bacterium]